MILLPQQSAWENKFYYINLSGLKMISPSKYYADKTIITFFDGKELSININIDKFIEILKNEHNAKIFVRPQKKAKKYI